MSGVDEVVEALKSLESALASYVGYDSMVGGLVSRSMKMLAEARRVLSEPTEENIQEALKNVRACRDGLSPYAGYAPELMRQAEDVIGKLQSLQHPARC